MWAKKGASSAAAAVSRANIAVREIAAGMAAAVETAVAVVAVAIGVAAAADAAAVVEVATAAADVAVVEAAVAVAAAAIAAAANGGKSTIRRPSCYTKPLPAIPSLMAPLMWGQCTACAL